MEKQKRKEKKQRSHIFLIKPVTFWSQCSVPSLLSIPLPTFFFFVFFPVFGCLTVSSVLTHWYTWRTPLAGVHTQVPVVLPPSVSQIKIPFTRFCPSSSPLPRLSHTLCKVSVCNLVQLTGLRSGEITARRATFLPFTSVWITLVSGWLPSTAC